MKRAKPARGSSRKTGSAVSRSRAAAAAPKTPAMVPRKPASSRPPTGGGTYPAAAAAAPDDRPAPMILIHVEPTVSGGSMHNRFDVQILGRVASSAAIEDIELRTEGAVIARASFGQPPPEQMVTLPDGTDGWQRAFLLVLPRPLALATGLCSCELRARTTDGHSRTEILELAIDPAAPAPVSSRSGPLLPGAAASAGRPHVLLFVERVLLDDDRNLTVQGWALAMTQIVTVQVFAGDNERLPAAQLGGPRDDVANAFPAYPNARQSGFTCTGRVSPAASLDSIRVQAISLNGFAMDVVVPVERVSSRPPQHRPAPRLVAEAEPEPARPFSPFRQEPAYKLTADFSIAADPLPTLESVAVSEFDPPQSFDTAQLAYAPIAEVTYAKPPQDERRTIHYFCDLAIVTPDGMLMVEGWAASAVGIGGVSVYLGREKLGRANWACCGPMWANNSPTSRWRGCPAFGSARRSPTSQKASMTCGSWSATGSTTFATKSRPLRSTARAHRFPLPRKRRAS